MAGRGDTVERAPLKHKRYVFDPVNGRSSALRPMFSGEPVTQVIVLAKEINTHAQLQLTRVYFKRGVQPRCAVQNEKCGVQNWKMWSPK